MTDASTGFQMLDFRLSVRQTLPIIEQTLQASRHASRIQTSNNAGLKGLGTQAQLCQQKIILRNADRITAEIDGATDVIGGSSDVGLQALAIGSTADVVVQLTSDATRYKSGVRC